LISLRVPSYRIWDKTIQKFVPLSGQTLSVKEDKVFFGSIDLVQDENFVLQWGTDFPDDTGKKIFEGDFCLFFNLYVLAKMSLKEPTVGEIKYQDGAFRWFCSVKPNSSLVMNRITCLSMNIIGNVFSPPKEMSFPLIIQKNQEKIEEAP